MLKTKGQKQAGIRNTNNFKSVNQRQTICNRIMDLLGRKVCLICFNVIQNNILADFNKSQKIFNNCFYYLHTDVAENCTKDIQWANEMHLPFCKICFDAASELTQLHEQLGNLQKQISDLTVAFSLGVLYRRNDADDDKGKNKPNSPGQKFQNQITNLHPNMISLNSAEKETQPNISEVSPHKGIINIKSECNDPENSLTTNRIEILEDEDLFTNFFPEEEINENGVQMDPLRINEVKVSQKSKRFKSVTNEIIVENINSLVSSATTPTIAFEIEFGSGHKGKRTSSHNQSVSWNQLEESTASNGNSNSFSDPGIANPLQINFNETDKNEYKCNYCPRTFSEQNDLSNHTRSHTRGKPHQCTECGRKFKDSHGLICHERSHSGERPFKCSFCGKGFIRTNHLRDHERIHTGERPFQCAFCDRRFLDTSARSKHQRTHLLNPRTK